MGRLAPFVVAAAAAGGRLWSSGPAQQGEGFLADRPLLALAASAPTGVRLFRGGPAQPRAAQSGAAALPGADRQRAPSAAGRARWDARSDPAYGAPPRSRLARFNAWRCCACLAGILAGLWSGSTVAGRREPRPTFGFFATPASRLGSQMRAAPARMSEDAEAAARQRWLQSQPDAGTWGRKGSQSQPARSTQDELQARQREREEARKRMLASMGGSSAKLNSGAGVQFGFGGEDDENYGYGPRKQNHRAEIDESRELPAWVTTDLVGSKEPMNKPDLGGFDGRKQGWARKVETEDPNPPPMANTLRAPAETSVPVQSFMYGFDGQRTEDLEGSERSDDAQNSPDVPSSGGAQTYLCLGTAEDKLSSAKSEAPSGDEK